MSRYIDADAIIEKKWQAESEACFYALEDVVSVTDIEEAPTIDIVRCKECKYHFYDESNDCKMCYIHEYGEIWEDDDYCSYGERED